MADNDSMSSDTGVECLLFPEHPGYCEALVVCKRVSASVSLVGTVFVLFIIVLFKRYRYFSQRLITHLCLGSVLLSISYCLADINETPSPICVAQGALIMYSIVCVCGWIMIIMANLYVVTFHDKTLQKHEKLLTLFAWLLPVLFMVLPFAGQDVYGPAGVWCWIKNDWRWRFGLWYIIRIVSVFTFVIVAFWIAQHIIKMARISSSSVTDFYASHDDVRTLRMYPIAYFLLNVFSVINRIQNSIADADESSGHVFWLTLMQTICEPFIGGGLALAFIIDKKTLQSLTRVEVTNAFQSFCKKPADNVMEYPVLQMQTTSVSGSEEFNTQFSA